MPLYTSEDFEKSLIPNHLKKDSRELIEVASILGWLVHITTKDSVSISSPVGNKKYHFGVSGRATVNHNRIKKDIWRYGDPEKVAAAHTIIHAPDSAKAAAKALEAAEVIPLLGEKGTIVDQRPETEEPKEVRNSEPEEKPEPRIISSRPMKAKRARGMAYESETTLERKWSDGTTDYTCTLCDYYSVHRLSVSRHFGTTHNKGLGTQAKPASFKAEVPEASQYAPRKSRIEALAALLEGVLSRGATAEEIAKAALEWVHETSNSGGDLAAEREPMTAEETLARIKSLLDDGSHYALVEQTREQDERIAALEAEAAEAKAEAEKARTTLRTFIELAQELGQEDEE